MKKKNVMVCEPRPSRLQYEGALYHVFSRGNRRERIFWNGADYGKFEEFLMEATNWSGVKLYAWCLMPNHFHLLVETPDANLSEFLRRVLTRYARYFNWTHKTIGHVFQSRYKSILCDKESYLLELVRYIHLNPYKVKKKDFVGPSGWRWSSQRYYSGSVECPDGLGGAIHSILERFGPDLARARHRYAQFLADGLKEGNWEDFYAPKGEAFLGEERFIERAKHQGGEPVRRVGRSLRRIQGVVELAQYAKDCFGIKGAELAAANRERRLNRVRQAVVYVGKRHYRFSTTALARYLGREASAVSMMLRRMNEKEEIYPETQKLLKALARKTTITEKDSE